MTAEEEEVKYKGKIVSPGVDLVCVSHFTLTRTLTRPRAPIFHIGYIPEIVNQLCKHPATSSTMFESSGARLDP